MPVPAKRQMCREEPPDKGMWDVLFWGVEAPRQKKK